jgi:hypothetical protein
MRLTQTTNMDYEKKTKYGSSCGVTPNIKNKEM